jgi:hypothetical protein
MSNPNIKTVIFNGETVRAASMPGFKRYLILELGIILYSETSKICPDYHGNNGYRKIKIYPDGRKERKAFWLNRLVWQAFYGEIPEGMQIDHIDGDRLNNALVNLRPVTPKQNCLFKKQRDSNYLFNEKNPQRKKKKAAVKNA